MNETLPLPPPLSLVFVRHGEVQQGVHADAMGPPLTKRGEKQAERVATRLKDEAFDHIYVSSLRRASQTADAILDHHEQAPRTVTADLHEVLHHHFTAGPTPRRRPVHDNMKEERAAMNRFVDAVRRSHEPGSRILVVCHGNIIRTMIALFACRLPKSTVLIDINHTAICILEAWENGEAVLRLANCVKHLPPEQIT